MILVAWGHGATGLTERFTQARAAWPTTPGLKPTATTYQGWAKALRRGGDALVHAAADRLRAAMAQVAGRSWFRFRWCVLAVDGSRFELPRTVANEAGFGASAKRGAAPQAWVTLLWHMGLGLPWCWRIGPGHASERDHLRQMIHQAPCDALIVADAGFTGYGLIRQVLDSGRHVLLRVGRHVRLIQELGYAQRADAHTVYLWPTFAQRDRQPPLVLRLIRVRPRDGRRHTVYLLTSVTDPARLSDEQAATLYRMRWGVELCYRSLKQTMQARKLRAHSSTMARLELHGLLLGLTLLGLISTEAILAQGHDPLNWSVAASLRAVRRAMCGVDRPLHWRAAVGQAIKDRYRRRCKAPRRWARKKQAARPPGRPDLRRAHPDEIVLALQLQPQ